MTSVPQYCNEVLDHITSKIGYNVLDDYVQYNDPSEVADSILASIESPPYIGINEEFVLLTMGKPIYKECQGTQFCKQLYFVAYRNNQPAITFTIGYQKYQDVCTLLKELGFTVESGTTTIVCSKRM